MQNESMLCIVFVLFHLSVLCVAVPLGIFLNLHPWHLHNAEVSQHWGAYPLPQYTVVGTPSVDLIV